MYFILLLRIDILQISNKGMFLVSSTVVRHIHEYWITVKKKGFTVLSCNLHRRVCSSSFYQKLLFTGRKFSFSDFLNPFYLLYYGKTVVTYASRASSVHHLISGKILKALYCPAVCARVLAPLRLAPNWSSPQVSAN